MYIDVTRFGKKVSYALLLLLFIQRLRHRPTINACSLAHAIKTGLRIVAMALNTMVSPADPPGKKEIRYHKSDTNCAALAPNTKRYPEAPPALKVK